MEVEEEFDFNDARVDGGAGSPANGSA